MKNTEREETLTLRILEAVESESTLTQRNLARRTGIALGLANSYLKRCVRKGLLKIHQAPANRYLYYLTPQGFAEKSRLTAQYLSSSLEFYRRAGDSCAAAIAESVADGHGSLVLCGDSDLAEIAALRAGDSETELAGVYDPEPERERLAGHPVHTSLDAFPGEHGYLVTALTEPQATYDALVERLGPDVVYVPRILSVRTVPGSGDGA